MMKRILLLLLLFPILSLSAQVQVGADQIEEILKHTEGKRIGLTANHTSLLTNDAQTHLLDTLISRGVRVVKLFSPEHGFRGDADAGAKIESGRDPKSGLMVTSLYGKNRKPTAEMLQGIDLMLFDMQDVGVRFYTYISTLTYLMEACAESGIPLLILDRPNPHDTIDGAVMKDKKYQSFVSLLPIPAVHGLTLGEAALMINGEGWLANGIKAAVTVIRVKGWAHGDAYSLPVPPSPNLKRDRAIAFYPTTCYFEGTSWSEGRGTETPFEVVGYPDKRVGQFAFTPISRPGATKPKHQDKRCYGPDLRAYPLKKGINLQIIIDAAKQSQAAGIDFITRPDFFNLLAGNGELRHQILSGATEAEIRASWVGDLQAYEALRRQYLLYPDCRTFFFSKP